MLAVIPGMCILIIVLAFNFVGDGLREALDLHPKVRSDWKIFALIWKASGSFVTTIAINWKRRIRHMWLQVPQYWQNAHIWGQYP